MCRDSKVLPSYFDLIPQGFGAKMWEKVRKGSAVRIMQEVNMDVIEAIVLNMKLSSRCF